jgi:FtsP/CotA-like multicopper oxidase with cupredoxin domain
MHVHEIAFEVVDRQALETNEDGETVLPARLVGDPRSPEPWESGFKDTVIAYPGEVTRLRAKFDNAGQYVWHCHIVEHEDNEMMRPYRIGPVQPGQPSRH